MDAKLVAARVELLTNQLHDIAAELAGLREQFGDGSKPAERPPLYDINALQCQLIWCGIPFSPSPTVCEFLAAVWGRPQVAFCEASESMIGAGKVSPAATVKSWVRRANEWAAAEEIPGFPIFSTKGNWIVANWPNSVAKG